jgi:signal transduction histidine kinase
VGSPAGGGAEADLVEAIGRVASRVGHDFNNMLMVIRSESELAALDVPAGNPAHEALANVRQAVDRAVAFTSRLLALNTQGASDNGVVDLNSVVAGVGELVPKDLGRISVVTERTQGTLSVRAGPEKVRDVLRHLVQNACEAMPSGGSLRITTSTIHLGRTRAASYQVAPGSFGVLTVADTGEGMSQEARARLFEAFLTTKSQREHLGLGLATTFAVVRRAEGAIEVESEPARGTTVRVYLPTSSEPPGEDGRAVEGATRAESAQHRRL